MISDGSIFRAVLGAALAGGIAFGAERLGALTRSGALAAIVVGAAASAAGWGWAALVVGYFVVLSAATRLGRATKAARTAGVLEASHARTAAQVAANGGVFALGALAVSAAGAGVAAWAGCAALAALGALAASAADTAATEFGILWGGTPRSILTWRLVEAGTSGAVTATGFSAALLAAVVVAAAGTPLLVAPFDAPPMTATIAFAAIAIGGFAGSLGDSLLGATLQARRQCDACGALTERRVHSCGGTTRHARGLRWMTNDVVNLYATLVGAATAVAVAAARS